MASSGMRLGGFVGLRDGDIRPIFDDATGKKLLAAHVVVYKGTDDEYANSTIGCRAERNRVKPGRNSSLNPPVHRF